MKAYLEIGKTNRFLFLKEGSWIVIGQIVSVAGSIVLVKILSDKLSPSQYGQMALGLTTSSLINNIIIGGINNGIARYYSIAFEKNDIKGYLISSLKLQIYATLTTIVIGLIILFSIFQLGQTQWLLLASAAIIYSIISGFNGSLNGIQGAARQRFIVAFHSGLDSWLKILLAMTFMLLFGASAESAVFGYASSSLIVCISQLFFLKKIIPIAKTITTISLNHDWVKQIWLFSWPFSTWGIFAWVQQVSDRWVLGAFGSTADVGHYAVLFQLSYTPILLASGVFVTFLSPILFQRAGDATDKNRILDLQKITIKLSWLCIGLTCTAFILSLFIHKWLFHVLLGEKYQQISYLMPWMILAGGFMAAHQILGSRIASLLKTKQLALQQILMCLFAASLNLAGAKYWGLKGLVCSLVVFSFLYFYWMYLFSNSIIKKEISKLVG